MNGDNVVCWQAKNSDDHYRNRGETCQVAGALGGGGALIAATYHLTLLYRAVD